MPTPRESSSLEPTLLLWWVFWLWDIIGEKLVRGVVILDIPKVLWLLLSVINLKAIPQAQQRIKFIRKALKSSWVSWRKEHGRTQHVTILTWAIGTMNDPTIRMARMAVYFPAKANWGNRNKSMSRRIILTHEKITSDFVGVPSNGMKLTLLRLGFLCFLESGTGIIVFLLHIYSVFPVKTFTSHLLSDDSCRRKCKLIVKGLGGKRWGQGTGRDRGSGESSSSGLLQIQSGLVGWFYVLCPVIHGHFTSKNTMNGWGGIFFYRDAEWFATKVRAKSSTNKKYHVFGARWYEHHSKRQVESTPLDRCIQYSCDRPSRMTRRCALGYYHTPTNADCWHLLKQAGADKIRNWNLRGENASTLKRPTMARRTVAYFILTAQRKQTNR